MTADKLSSPRSPHAIRAPTKECPNCGAPPRKWCYDPKGRKLTRIHFARATFVAESPMSQ